MLRQADTKILNTGTLYMLHPFRKTRSLLLKDHLSQLLASYT